MERNSIKDVVGALAAIQDNENPDRLPQAPHFMNYRRSFVKIITIIENTKSNNTRLVHERGLSLYIETNDTKILFDTGKNGNIVNNAKYLNIDIEKINIVVLSHGHHDHGGGLIPFFKENNNAIVYAKEEAFDLYYFKYGFLKKDISIDTKVREHFFYRIKTISKFSEIAENVYIVTNIVKSYETPKGNAHLFSAKQDTLIRDSFNHELIMVIREPDGLVIFTGCAHNGIANIIETVTKQFNSEFIKGLIGGFHLTRVPSIMSLFELNDDNDDIDLIIKKVIDNNIKKIYTGHCTGRKAYRQLKNRLGYTLNHLETGLTIII